MRDIYAKERARCTALWDAYDEAEAKLAAMQDAFLHGKGPCPSADLIALVNRLEHQTRGLEMPPTPRDRLLCWVLFGGLGAVLVTGLLFAA